MAQVARQNLSTSSVKNQLEGLFSYSNTAVKHIGTGSVSAEDTVTWAAGDDSIGVYGEDLVLRASFPVQADAAATYTITGTKISDSGALTGEAVMPANSPQGRAVDVTPSETDLFETVTDISVVGGAAGDKVEVLTVPVPGSFTLLSFFESFEINTGPYLRSIPNRYDVSDHKKRQRQENTITASQLYTNHADGLAQIEGQDVTLMIQIEDDGGGSITETIMLSNSSLSTPLNMAKDADAIVNGEGEFSRKIVFT
jgi:hypothetical protein